MGYNKLYNTESFVTPSIDIQFIKYKILTPKILYTIPYDLSYDLVILLQYMQ